MKTESSPTKAGWRVAEWARDTGLSRSYAYDLMKAKTIAFKKAGTARIITTSPAAYLASLPGGDANAA